MSAAKQNQQQAVAPTPITVVQPVAHQAQAGTDDAVALNRAYCQSIIDNDACGTGATGGADVEAFADRLCAEHPITDRATRRLLTAAIRAYIEALSLGYDHGYWGGREAERENWELGRHSAAQDAA